MRGRISYLFWIFMLAFGLMVLIVSTQLLVNRNINELQRGNREAAITFTINNRLQDLINLSFELESKVTHPVVQPAYRETLIDSFSRLGYNASVFREITLNPEADKEFDKLNAIIDRQIGISTAAIDLVRKKDNRNAQHLIDSLRRLRLTDSVYTTALSIEKTLEKELQATLSSNIKGSFRLSAYNKVLAITAIGAVLILGTIIINRHLKQVQLIADLEKAKTQAQLSATVKEQFLANMSHEIRTPLNAIKGFSRILANTPLTKEQQQYAAVINEASDNLIYIVNDILDISKIEAGKMRIDKKDFDLQKVLSQLERMFLNTSGKKDILYSQQIEKNVPLFLKGDPERLLQILVNLVSNGIKFTDQGFVQTKVRLHKKTANTKWIEFEVEDSGIGISPELQDVIFQRFEQLNNNENVTKGTGLGLSIVKSLTELMGGTVSVQGESGKGSVFKVLLPFEESGKYIPEEEQTVVKTPSFHSRDVEILVAEDNKVNQMLLFSILSSSGLNVDIVSNGEEAIEMLTHKKYSLVFMDIQMPALDGYATTKAIRETLGLDVPVIAMTAYAMSSEKERCLASGMNDYLPKPVDLPALYGVLTRYISPDDPVEVEDDLIDRENLFRLAGGNKTLAGKMLEAINKELPASIHLIEGVLADKEKKDLNKVVHYLVSTFGALGAGSPVMKLIERIKTENSLEKSGQIEKLLHQLIREIKLLEARFLAAAAAWV